MKFLDTGFKGLLEIYPKVFEDPRGSFFEFWNSKEFELNGIDFRFSQDNQSCSEKDVLRGLHLQLPPYEQGKLVRVVTGKVLDVVVDLRKEEPTFGKHYKTLLAGNGNNMLWIPPGFAHGFLTLEDNTVFIYKCTKLYNKESERIIKWDDPELSINWGCKNPIISEKDKLGILFRDFDSPF